MCKYEDTKIRKVWKKEASIVILILNKILRQEMLLKIKRNIS